MLGQPVRNMIWLEGLVWLMVIPVAILFRWMGMRTLPWPVLLILFVAGAVLISRWRTGWRPFRQ